MFSVMGLPRTIPDHTGDSFAKPLALDLQDMPSGGPRFLYTRSNLMVACTGKSSYATLRAPQQKLQLPPLLFQAYMKNAEQGIGAHGLSRS